MWHRLRLFNRAAAGGGVAVGRSQVEWRDSVAVRGFRVRAGGEEGFD